MLWTRKLRGKDTGKAANGLAKAAKTKKGAKHNFIFVGNGMKLTKIGDYDP